MKNAFTFSLDTDVPDDATKKLVKATEKAFKAVADELDGRFADAIAGKYWPWPRQTMRGNNTLTSSPRSIYDMGSLAQSRNFELTGLHATWSWNVKYAAAVHEGASIYPWGNKGSGKVQLPGRPWTTAVLVGGTPGSVPVYDFTGNLSKRIADYL